MRRASIDAGTVAGLLVLLHSVKATSTGFENAVAKHAAHKRTSMRALHSHRKAESLHIKKSKARIVDHCSCEGFQITVFYRSVKFTTLHTVKTYKHAYDAPLQYLAVVAPSGGKPTWYQAKCRNGTQTNGHTNMLQLGNRRTLILQLKGTVCLQLHLRVSEACAKRDSPSPSVQYSCGSHDSRCSTDKPHGCCKIFQKLLTTAAVFRSLSGLRNTSNAPWSQYSTRKQARDSEDMPLTSYRHLCASSAHSIAAMSDCLERFQHNLNFIWPLQQHNAQQHNAYPCSGMQQSILSLGHSSVESNHHVKHQANP